MSTNVAVAAQDSEPAAKVTAFFDSSLKECWIIAENSGDDTTLNIIIEGKVEFTETKVTFKGTIDTKHGGDEPKGILLSYLIPFLTTKIDEDIVRFKGLNFQIMKDLSEEPENLMYGEPRTLDELADENAMIIAKGTKSSAVLSSSEKDHAKRKIFIFQNLNDAQSALNAYKKFPPFHANFFYQEGKCITLADVEIENLNKEKFLFYDVWQKAVANLSAHMQVIEEDKIKNS